MNGKAVAIIFAIVAVVAVAGYFLFIDDDGDNRECVATFYCGDDKYTEAVIDPLGHIEAPKDPTVPNGYYFVGWYTDESDLSSRFDFNSKQFSNVVLYALIAERSDVFDPNKDVCVIQYVFNDVDIKSYIVCYNVGETITLPEDPVVKGYSFKGWYRDSAYTLPYVGQPLRSNMVLYASFIKTGYVATFIADNTIVEKVPFNKGDAVIKEPAVPQKPGYTGSWPDYDLNDDVVIKAVYKLNTYVISFYVDGSLYQQRSYNVENTAIDVPEVPKKDGTEGRWSQFEISKTNPQDMRVDAIYSEKVFKVTFNPNQGILNGKNGLLTVDVLYGDTIDLDDYVPERQDYTFDYWYKDGDDSVIYDGRVTVMGDIDFVAKWVNNGMYMSVEAESLYDGDPVYISSYQKDGVIYSSYSIGLYDNIILQYNSAIVTSQPGVSHEYKYSVTNSDTIAKQISETVTNSTTTEKVDSASKAGEHLAGVANGLNLASSICAVIPGGQVASGILGIIGSSTSIIGTIFGHMESDTKTITTEEIAKSWSNSREIYEGITKEDISKITFDENNSTYGKQYVQATLGIVEYIQVEMYDYDGNYLGNTVVGNIVDKRNAIWIEYESQENMIAAKKISRSTVDDDYGRFIEVAKKNADGSDSKPFIITDQNEMKNMKGSFHYQLWSDIKMSGNWTPLGSSSSTFKGKFDGQGHTISDMRIVSLPAMTKISQLVDNFTLSAVGMFSIISNGSEICNINFENVYVNPQKNKDGDQMGVGVIAGISQGAYIHDITLSSGTVTCNEAWQTCTFGGGIAGIVGLGTRISDCINQSVEVTVDGNNCYAGGMVGWIVKGGASIDHCINTAHISAKAYGGAFDYRYGHAGGMVGRAEYTGTVTIDHCYNNARIDSNMSWGYRDSGAIMGCNSASDTTISNCFYIKGTNYEANSLQSSTVIVDGGRDSVKYTNNTMYESVSKYDFPPGWFDSKWIEESNVRFDNVGMKFYLTTV